jgi:hypothetical protein
LLGGANRFERGAKKSDGGEGGEAVDQRALREVEGGG